VIGSVRGTVIELTATGEALVEVGGVGYRVLVPVPALAALQPGTNAFLFTHQRVHDDQVALYGFPTREERDTFEVLLRADGVGPKLALAILSVLPPTALRRAVVDEDLASLTLVPGVGRRTAQKLLVELQARLEAPVASGADVPGSAGSARGEVRAALAGLGYDPEEVRDALAELPDDGAVEDLLRDALKLLAVTRT
jgi:holliday junction DNA helicase RuvA